MNLAASTTVTIGPTSTEPLSAGSASTSSISPGWATPVASMTTRRVAFLSRSSSSAFTSEPFSVQQRHPELISIMSTLCPDRMAPSMPTSPNSFTMTAIGSRPPRSPMIRRMRVVLPEPRNPQIGLTSITPLRTGACRRPRLRGNRWLR